MYAESTMMILVRKLCQALQGSLLVQITLARRHMESDIPTRLLSVRIEWLDLSSKPLKLIAGSSSERPLEICRQVSGDVFCRVLARVT